MNGCLLFGVSHVPTVPWMCSKPAFDFLEFLSHSLFVSSHPSFPQEHVTITLASNRQYTSKSGIQACEKVSFTFR